MRPPAYPQRGDMLSHRDASGNQQARDNLQIGSVGHPGACGLPKNFRSLPEGPKAIEFLNENAMRPVRYLHKIGAGRHSIRHKRLLIEIVLRLIANQDAILGRSWIYVVQFSSVRDRGNLARRQPAHSLLLFGRGHGLCLESGSHQQVFLLNSQRWDRPQCSGIPTSGPAIRLRQTHPKIEMSFPSFSFPCLVALLPCYSLDVKTTL